MSIKLPIEFKIIQKKNGKCLLFFPNDSSIIWAKKPVMDILRSAIRFSKLNLFKNFSTRYRRDVLMDVYKDILFLRQMGSLKSNNKKPWLRLRYSGDFSPNRIWIHLTHRCNLNCPYCYLRNSKNKNTDPHCIDMDWDTAKKIIDWAFKINKVNSDNSMEFIFFGGEPLLKPELLERSLKYIKGKEKYNKSKSVIFSILTNGALINENIAGLLKKYNVMTMVTMHKKNKETIGGIKILRKYLPSCNLRVNKVIIDRVSIRDALSEVGKIKGIMPTFSFDFYLKGKHFSALLNEMKKRNNSVKKGILCINSNIGLNMLLGGIKVTENCGALQASISFFPDGSMHSCSGPASFNFSRPLGNVHTGGINRELYKNEMEKIESRDRRRIDCIKCWIRSYCEGDCKYNNQMPSIIEGKHPSCDARRWLMERSIKIFANFNNRDIFNMLESMEDCKVEKAPGKYNKTGGLLLQLRDLRNKRLRYAKILTLVLH